MKPFLSICSVLLLAFALLAQTIPIVSVTVTSEFTGIVQSGSDTQRFSAWTGSSTGGTYNGGHIYGTCLGDAGLVGETGTLGHTQVCELGAYDPYNPANTTLTVINKMADYDFTAHGCPGDTGNAQIAMSGHDIWSDGGNLYQAWFCQNLNNFGSLSAWIIVSPDSGVHWCNLLGWTAQSNACNSSSPWSTTGAIPVTNASTAVQFNSCTAISSGCEALSRMGKLAIIQTAQDGAAQPTIPGVDTTYTYAIVNQEPTATNVTHKLFACRYLRSATGGPMLAANWACWDGSTWNSTLSAEADIIPSAWSAQTVFTQTAMWAPRLNAFLLIGIGAQATFPIAYSTLPQGPYTVIPNVAYPTPSFRTGYMTFMLPTLTNTQYGGFTVSLSNNGYAADVQTPPYKTLAFVQMRFDPPNVSAGMRVH